MGREGLPAYLGMFSSTVAHPYRNTMTPTTDAGMSIWVYTPSQAKYRPIFSPKYFLHRRAEPNRGELMLAALACVALGASLPARSSSNRALGSPEQG